MMPAFVAMKRIVAASRPTYSSPTPWNGPRSRLLDDPQHRVAGEAALVLGQAEQRRALPVDASR